ncbi:AraC family transcriptional regulator [Paenibacillus ginsengihumi]|uniref:AraC family transcriptional regulator n=1 Tax=Paenibacillus ginsengihumi TaxID=431596 RepID=UPI000373BF33|nr:AraC family transcriptional regulator [Paenibacillus ginsengihumi]
MMQEYEYEYAEFVYYTPKGLDKEGLVWPVRAGRSRAKPHYKAGPKRIECCSLHFVMAGRVRLEWEGQQVELQKDDLFCLFPGVTYSYCLLPADAPLQLRWLAVDGPRALPLLELAGLRPETPYREQACTPHVRESAERMIGALGKAGTWSPALSLKLHSLLFELFSHLCRGNADSEENKKAGWIRECVDFMELHAAEGISVQQVADFAGVHRSYFSQAFTEEMGISPSKYLQQLRMDKAKRLLKDTDATVTEIALSLGYPNLYSFTRAFKSYCSCSPLAFRQNESRS